MTKHKNFKGQFEDEEVLCYFRKHWIKILPTLILIPILLLAIFSALIYAEVLVGESPMVKIGLFIGFASFLVLMHRQFTNIFYYYLHTVLITNYRIVEIDKSVFFRNSKESVDLSKIQDIQKIQNGVLENVLNYGSLRIILSGTHSTVDLELVPRPNYQFKKMNVVKQQYMPSRNVPVSRYDSVEKELSFAL
jgi:hypothetical protein